MSLKDDIEQARSIEQITEKLKKLSSADLKKLDGELGVKVLTKDKPLNKTGVADKLLKKDSEIKNIEKRLIQDFAGGINKKTKKSSDALTKLAKAIIDCRSCHGCHH